MKKPIILGFAVLALTSFTASADNQYPAANFEPQVIYIDKASASVANEVDAKYPAANFQPTVIYSATPSVAKTTAAPVVDEFDPKYPAANFQPKVIYP